VPLHSTDERQRTLADAVDQVARAELRKVKMGPQQAKKSRGGGSQSGTEVARNRKRAS
jgi:hypothetical protein